MKGAAAGPPETIVAQFEHEAGPSFTPVEHFGLAAAAATEGVEKFRLVAPVDPERVMRGRGTRSMAPLTCDIFEDPLIHDDSLAVEGPFETADVAMAMSG